MRERGTLFLKREKDKDTDRQRERERLEQGLNEKGMMRWT
jgi:hypothetical protein